MIISVNKTVNASPDGINIQKFCSGQCYDMPAQLAATFIDQGWGNQHEEKPAKSVTPPNNKMRDAFSNKSAPKRRGRPPKNKVEK